MEDLLFYLCFGACRRTSTHLFYIIVLHFPNSHRPDERDNGGGLQVHLHSRTSAAYKSWNRRKERGRKKSDVHKKYIPTATHTLL